MTPVTVIKRGDTFVVSCVYGSPPVDITGIDIASQMVRDAVTVTAVVVKTDPANGAFSLTFSTPSMEAGNWLWDIQYSVGSVVVSAPSDTNMRVRVIDGVTA
jgi:hypothetical protein